MPTQKRLPLVLILLICVHSLGAASPYRLQHGAAQSAETTVPSIQGQPAPARASVISAGTVGWVARPIWALLASDPLQQARERAVDAGSYSFDSEIQQTLIARPMPETIGQGDTHVEWHAQGQVQLPDRSTSTMWFDGGERVTLVREGQRTFVRRGEELQEIQDPTPLAAPGADLMAYLDAARNVRALEPEVVSGVRYTRYAFEVDGPRFAEQVRQQIERELAGQIPEGGQVVAPAVLQSLQGTGELWVDAQGLPRRQVLDLRFPQAAKAYDAQVHAVTTFRGYGQPQVAATVVLGQDGAWRLQEVQPGPASAPAPKARTFAPYAVMLLLLCLLCAAVAFAYRRFRRQTYAAVTVFVLALMLLMPNLQSLQWLRFYGSQVRAAPAQMLTEALAQSAAGSAVGAETPISPTPPAPDTAPLVPGDATPIGEGARQCGDGSPTVDTDNDGLFDSEEACYGTDPYEADSDFDGVNDGIEAAGYTDGAGKHWTSNPLKADANGDGLPDLPEWPAPVGAAPSWDPDHDGLPNMWDPDNDGDGVPDSIDFSVYAVGNHAESLDLQVSDLHRQGYQYIEFQLQPTNTQHLNYTTTWLDWPDNDTGGQITSRITGVQDLRLSPFLDVQTDAIPEQGLLGHYGLAVLRESGQAPHLLIPLFAQSVGHAVSCFQSKVVYGPSGPAVVRWETARLVWMVQVVKADGSIGLVQQYSEPFRLTGMQVTKSEGYELGLFGTPNSVNEDKPLFNLLFGMSATFLEYGELEGQVETTALREVRRRFESLAPTSTHRWGVTETVRSSVQGYGHQDEALATSNRQVADYLNAHYVHQPPRCTDARGAAFDCAAVAVATEERLVIAPAEDLGQSQIRLDVTAAEVFTTRNLRYQMYERRGSEWDTVSRERTMEIVEQRYAGQWANMVTPYVDDYALLRPEDFRFAAYLAYATWQLGRTAAVSVGEVPIVEPQSPDESSIIGDLGVVLNTLTNLPDYVMQFTKLPKAINAARAKLADMDTWENQYDIWVDVLLCETELRASRKERAIASMKAVLSGVALAVGIANVACAGEDAPCDATSLKVATNFIEGLAIASEAHDVYGLLKAAKAAGSSGNIAFAWKAMSRSAKAAAIAGLALELGLIWTQFGLTFGGKSSGFQFDATLGTAIVSTILAVVIFILMMIPGVNIVVGIVLCLIATIDLLLSLFGSDFSVMGAAMSAIYRAEMLTEVESAGYLGGGSGLSDEALGLVAGNRFRFWDTFRAVLTGSEETQRAWARAEWSGALASGVSPTSDNGPTYAPESSSTRRVLKNTVGVRFDLLSAQPNVRLVVNTKIHWALRYKRCGLWIFCTYHTDESDTADSFDLVLDVLPRTLDGLWSWSALGNPDRDGDGLSGAEEARAGTNPLLWDTDGDGLSDGAEVHTLYTNPLKAGSDQDGLEDGAEIRWGTNPNNADTDGDGLRDGDEVAGWEVHLTTGRSYWVFSDPLQADVDGDGLTDAAEKASGTSPNARNLGPLLFLSPSPVSASPLAGPGAYVTPGVPVTVVLNLLNTADQAVTSTLGICLSSAHLSNIQLTGSGVTAGTAPPAQAVGCGAGQTGYTWDFSAAVGVGISGTRPYVLPAGRAFSATLSMDTLGPSGSVPLTCTLRYKGQELSQGVTLVVDDDNPTASVSSPADGAILTGERYILGITAADPSSWVKEVELLIDANPDASVQVGAPVTTTGGPAAWAYAWTLPSDGEYTLATRARDAFGHLGAQTQVAVRVDNTPPTVTLNLAGGSMLPATARGVTVTGQAIDNLTGLSRAQVSVDGGPWREASLAPAPDPATGSYPLQASWTYSWTVGVEAQGSHSVAARALDRAGNLGAPQQADFVLDAAPPSDDLLTRLGDETPILKADPSITLTGYANDAGKVPLPPRPAALHGTLDTIADATVWLSPESIHEDDAGAALVWLGDMDGDGRADLAIGLPAAAGGAGKVVVVYGRYGDWRLPPDAQPLAHEWTTFVGAAGAGLGAQVAAVGDVDGDGLDDLLVGDPANRRAFLIYGQPYRLGAFTGPNVVLDGPLSGRRTMLTLSGDQPFSQFVAPAGDVNGDGYADLIISGGASAYLILGHAGPWYAQVDVGAESAAVASLPQGGRATGVGDVNGDQYDDWVVTDPVGSWADGIGLHLLAGGAAFARHAHQAIDPRSDSRRLAFLLSSGMPTGEVVALGDVNGDGRDDLLYPSADVPQLVLGREGAPWGSLPLYGYYVALDGFLAAPGDVDGDGLNDFMLGTRDGRAYLVLGRRDWSGWPGIQATLMGVAGAASAPFAAGADMNCDGSADLLLLPAAAGVNELLSAAQPFASASTVSQEALSVSVAAGPLKAPDGQPQGMLMAAAGRAATADTFFVDDDYCATCANDGHAWGINAFAAIAAAVAAADAFSDTVIVGPGVYAPFEIGPGKEHLTVRGVDADAVFVQGPGWGDVVYVHDVIGVHLAEMTLRNAACGVRLVHAGRGIGSSPTPQVELDHLLIHTCEHALCTDRVSRALVRRSTLVAQQSDQAIIEVGGEPDPDLSPAWQALGSVPSAIGAGGALVSASEWLYAIPGSGSGRVYRYAVGGAVSTTLTAPHPVVTSTVSAGDGSGRLWLAFASPAELWSYDPIGAGWTRKSDPPVQGWGAASLASDGADGLYLLLDDGRFLRYGLAADAWQEQVRAWALPVAAYVAGGANGLRVLDVSAPHQPTEVGSYDTPGHAADVSVVGQYAYLADTTSGLQVIDTTVDPPNRVGWVDTPGNATDVAVSGYYAYVADTDGGLTMIDVRNPQAPAVVASVAMGTAWGVAASGNYAYVANGDDGLGVVDIVSRPPRLVTRLSTPSTALDVVVVGRYAYIADYFAGLLVVDISAPASPRLVGSCDTPGHAWGVTVSGDTAYVADLEGGLQIIDIHVPTAPTRVGSYDPAAHWYEARGVAVAGEYAYVAHNDSGSHSLWVVDVSNLANPTFVSSYGLSGWAEGVDVVARPRGTALAWADGKLYALGDRQLWRYDPTPGAWTRLADAPAGIGAGASLAPDRTTAAQYLYAALGGDSRSMARYAIATNAWEAIPLAAVKVGAGHGLAYQNEYLYLYGTPAATGSSNFNRYGPVGHSPDKLTLADTAFVAQSGVATQQWLNAGPEEFADWHAVTGGNTQWVADGAWWPATPTTSLLLQDARFLDPTHDVYRIGAGSALSGGYAASHADAYVSPAYCDTCPNDGLEWDVTAFASIQAAIDAGAPRVLLRPGVYQEPFYLVSGLQLIGSGAETTIIQPPPGALSGTLVTAEGVAAVTLGRLTLDGAERLDGLRVEDGARAVRVARCIVRHADDAVVVDGAATEVEIVNDTLVSNVNGVVARGCATVDMRNTILADHAGAALSLQQSSCAPEPRHVYRYNLYWHNAQDLLSDGAPQQQPGTGELRANPRFISPGAPAYNYALLSASPAIDAGDPSDPIPPGTGSRVDIGYLEMGQAAFAVDDDYCATCLNDGLIWQVNAFDRIQDGLDAAERLVVDLGGALQGALTVGVGPGLYREHLSVPSHVRLVGYGADDVTLDGLGVGTVVTLDGVADAEVRGLRITGSGPGQVAIRVTGYSHDVMVARNLIEGNGQGVVFDGQSTGTVSFCTIVGSSAGAGLGAAGANAWVAARNNILADNAIGLRAEGEGQVFSDYNLLDNALNYASVLTGAADIAANPQFALTGAMPYHLQNTSPAVDAADTAEEAPLGGGRYADIGYAERRAVPIALFLGRQGRSCAEGNAGVAGVQVALAPVADASQPVTATLPGAWVSATLETVGQVASYWSCTLTPGADGLHRVYTRAIDRLGNLEDDPLDWYTGAVLVDRTPPDVAWVDPSTDLTTAEIALRLRATAEDWLDTGAGQSFTVATRRFEANGTSYPATWAQDAWTEAGGGPRTFETLAPLWEGSNTLYAIATDTAGHERRSSPLTVTSTTPGDATAITSVADGGATSQANLELAGLVRFAALGGIGLVTVFVDGGAPVTATLADPSARFTTWQASVALDSDGEHTLTAVASRAASAPARQTTAQLQAGGTVSIRLDRGAPGLQIDAPVEGAFVRQSVTFSGAATDDGSGVQHVEVSLDGGARWEPATLSGDPVALQWSYAWAAPAGRSGVTYNVQVRATDRARNRTVATRSFTVDNEPPQGIEPLRLSIPVGAHLDSVQTLVGAWQPAVDGSGQVTVTAAIDRSPETAPDVAASGQSYAAPLDQNGAWYLHILARDPAGNGSLYHEGPWYVGLNDASAPCAQRQQSIILDGALDVQAREWLTETELLDSDERPSAPQSLYVTWDADAFYLGWEGATWGADGTLWAYLDTTPGGSEMPVAPAGLPALPFAADLAVQVHGEAHGTLWRTVGGGWQAEGLQFALHGDQLEARVPWDLASLGSLRLIAFALSHEAAAWATFPTNNPLGGPWTVAYAWPDLCSVQDRRAGQPRAVSVALSLSSNQDALGAWGNGQPLAFGIGMRSWESTPLTGQKLHLTAPMGLSFVPPLSGAICTVCPADGHDWTLTLPTLAAHGAHPVTVSARTNVALGALSEVAVHASLEASALPAATYAHAVDGLAPTVTINTVAGEALRPGPATLTGMAADGAAGSGVVAVEVRPQGGAWQPATGSGLWSVQLDIPAAPGAFMLEVEATDAAGNVGSVQQTYYVDAVGPEITFPLPTALAAPYTLLQGTARDPWPPEARVASVEIQVDDPASLWRPAAGPYEPDAGGLQRWVYTWALPEEDGGTHALRMRAVDAAGNVTETAWAQTWVDTVAPVVTATQIVTQATSATYAPGASVAPPVLTGRASDGTGVSQVRVYVNSPVGDSEVQLAQLSGSDWEFRPVLNPSVLGNYVLQVEAVDPLGNSTRLAGEFTLRVFSRILLPMVDLRAANDSPALRGRSTRLTATVQAGADVSHAWPSETEGMSMWPSGRSQASVSAP